MASIQSLVGKALKAHKIMRIADIRDLIGLSGAKGWARVNRAVHDLTKSGEIERWSHGRYRWVGGKKPDIRYYKKQIQIWRLMWIKTRRNEAFSVRDLHEATGVAYYTIVQYVTYLKKNGYLTPAGKRRAYKTAAPLYLVAAERMKQTDPPLKKRVRKTAEIEKRLDTVRELAAEFFRIEDTRKDTIQGLIGIADKIVGELRAGIKGRDKGQG